MLLFSLWVGRAIAADTGQWQMELGRSEALARKEDWSGAADTLSACYQGWSARQTFLHVVSRHDAVDDAEAMFRRAMAFAEAEEPSEFLAEVSDLQDQLRLLAEMEHLRLGNVL